MYKERERKNNTIPKFSLGSQKDDYRIHRPSLSRTHKEPKGEGLNNAMDAAMVYPDTSRTQRFQNAMQNNTTKQQDLNNEKHVNGTRGKAKQF